MLGGFNTALCSRTAEDGMPTRADAGAVHGDLMPGPNVADVFPERYLDKTLYNWFAKEKPHRTDCARTTYALVERSLAKNVVGIPRTQLMMNTRRSYQR